MKTLRIIESVIWTIAFMYTLVGHLVKGDPISIGSFIAVWLGLIIHIISDSLESEKMRKQIKQDKKGEI